MCSDSGDGVQSDWHEAVFETVRRIPHGKVATYGQIADLITTVSVGPRQVGAAMRFAPEGVPWQRVIGAGGRLPIANRSPDLKMLQRRLLQQEGVTFLGEKSDRVDMKQAQWLEAP